MYKVLNCFNGAQPWGWPIYEYAIILYTRQAKIIDGDLWWSRDVRNIMCTVHICCPHEKDVLYFIYIFFPFHIKEKRHKYNKIASLFDTRSLYYILMRRRVASVFVFQRIWEYYKTFRFFDSFLFLKF